MKKTPALTLMSSILLLGATHGASSTVPLTGCLTLHIREAMALNKERRPKYAALSGDASWYVSNQLIFGEWLSSFLVRKMEREALKYQRAGVPILCDEISPMANAPAFQEEIKPPLNPPARLPRIDTRKMKQEIKTEFEQSGFLGVASKVKSEIKNLSSYPEYHCMLRHTLESILITAQLAPRHDKLAQETGLPSPLYISWRFIRSQLNILGNVHRLDRDAFPIQARGIPILCQDVPPIPTE